MEMTRRRWFAFAFGVSVPVVAAKCSPSQTPKESHDDARHPLFPKAPRNTIIKKGYTPKKWPIAECWWVWYYYEGKQKKGLPPNTRKACVRKKNWQEYRVGVDEFGKPGGHW